MTRGMRLRRLVRARGRRAGARRSPAAGIGRRVRRESEPVVRKRFLQAVVCGVLFAALVLLKLVVPGNLAAFRGTLAQWLVQDADFTEAFSAVGHAVAAPQQFVESMGNAYLAVFGQSEATQVGGSTEVALPAENEAEASALPDYASGERPELPFAYASPLAGTLTSAFGWREDPNGGTRAFHTGVDLAADEGTPFASFADGTVGVVGESTVLGKYLTVQHDGGCETVYAHCSKVVVSSGQSVARGETLGEVGATGNATGAHLHFELLSGSKYIDPLPYVQKTV